MSEWKKAVKAEGVSGLQKLLGQVKQLAKYAEREAKRSLDQAEALAKRAEEEQGKHVG